VGPRTRLLAGGQIVQFREGRESVSEGFWKSIGRASASTMPR